MAVAVKQDSKTRAIRHLLIGPLRVEYAQKKMAPAEADAAP
jgi:hypothetical protein